MAKVLARVRIVDGVKYTGRLIFVVVFIGSHDRPPSPTNLLRLVRLATLISLTLSSFCVRAGVCPPPPPPTDGRREEEEPNKTFLATVYGPHGTWRT